MEKLAGYCLSAVLLAAGFVSVSAQEEAKYLKKGGTLTVEPPPVSGKITSVTWKHKGNFVAEWIDGKVELTYYGHFQNRTTMDTTTGSLEIRNVGPADSGVLSVEINNNVQSKTYNVTLIQPVSKPDVSIKPLGCHTGSESCTLVCGGNTEGVEPVTYSWDLGGDEWKNGGKDQTIINDETTHSVKEFSCRMKNPISEETSKPEPNLFYRAPGSTGSGGIAAIVIVVLVVGGVGGVVGYWKRHTIRNKIYSLVGRRQVNATPKGHYTAVNSANGSQQNNVQQGSAAGPGSMESGSAADPGPAAEPETAANPDPAAEPGSMELGPAADPGPAAEPETAAGPGSMESGPATGPGAAAGADPGNA